MIFNKNILRGKNIIVTGGRTGIGFEIVKLCLSYGAKVIVLGRDEKKLKRKFIRNKFLGKKLFYYQSNINDHSHLKKTIEGIVKRFKNIDILINNAGLNFRIETEKLKPNMMEYAFQTNLISPSYLSILLFKYFKRQRGYQKIINISAFTGIKAYPGFAVTQASKKGLDFMTRTMAIEWSPHKVLVNSIVPGPVDTENFRHAVTRLERVQGKKSAKIVDDFKKKELPLGEYTAKSDIANMVVYLSSDAGNNLTGQVIEVDGGVGIDNSFLRNNSNS